MALTSAEKKQAQRKRAKLDKKCITCCNTDRAPGLKVCEGCNESAKRRVQKSRNKKT